MITTFTAMLVDDTLLSINTICTTPLLSAALYNDLLKDTAITKRLYKYMT